MNGLTPKQAECLAVIKNYTAAHGCSPSYSEIAQRMGMSANSRAGVCALVTGLEQRGHVRRLQGQLRGRSRGLEIVETLLPGEATLRKLPGAELESHLVMIAKVLSWREGPDRAREILGRLGRRLVGAQ